MFRQFALETRGDPLAASSLSNAYYMKQSIIGNDESAFFAKVDREFETAVKDSLSDFQDYGLALITLEIA